MMHLWKQHGWFVLTLIFLLVLAGFTFYVSRQDSQTLHKDTVKLNEDLHALVDRKAPDWEFEQVLMAYVLQRQRQDFFSDIVRHVSLGLFVACVLIVAVDIHTRRVAQRDLKRQLNEVTDNVFAGVARRLLGRSTASELDSIMRQNYAKTSCGYQITLLGPPDEKGSDRVVAVFESWYSVKNLTSFRQSYPFEVDIRGYEPGSANVGGEILDLPKFVNVKIGGKEIPLDEIQSKDEPGKISKPVPLSEDSTQSVDFYVRAYLLYRTRHTEVFYSDIATEGSALTVNNEARQLIGKCSASVLHPAHKQVRNPAQGRWEFSRSLLPGQGWYVEWEPANSPSNRKLD